MRKRDYFFIGLFVFLIISIVSATLVSESYEVVSEGVSSGGVSSGSDSYNTMAILGFISGEAVSNSYIGQIGIFYGMDSSPFIVWENPTPSDGEKVLQRYVYLNTTITDSSNVSAFFDWNKSLVGYWSMDFYNSTGIFDNSTYDNFGIFNGGLETSNLTTARHGKGLDFDGVNDYVRVPHNVNLKPTDELTVSAWAYKEDWSVGSVGRIVSVTETGGYTITTKYSTNEKIGVAIYINGVYQWIHYEGVVSAGWNHIISTFDGRYIKLYLNGILVSTTDTGSYNPIQYSNDNSLIIGAEAGPADVPAGDYFNGSIDEVRIYNRVLSEGEINASYNNRQYRLYNNFTNLANGVYNYSAYAIDSFGKLTITTERSVNVSGNTAPTISILGPDDNNRTFDRTPTFTYEGSDAEGDSLIYDINITKEGASLCSDYNLDVQDYGEESYTPSVDLLCLDDNNDYYEWTVRACENETNELFCSDWTSVRTINITSLIDISLPTDSVLFGTMTINEVKNTTDPSLSPLAIQNDGNAKINISMNATQIWTSVSEDVSEYFQSKVGEYVGKASWANTSWFQIPTISGFAIMASDLNYSDDSDDLDVDLLLKVPASEDPGAKSSTINFQAELSEVYDAA